MKINLLSLLILLGFLACTPNDRTDKQNTSLTEYKDKTLPSNLWDDKTSIYLPVTAEWTNRIEIADLNGDQRLDILCANGGDYSQAGTPEHNRIFLNNGPDKKFTEATTAILGNEPDISRVIKVADVNNDDLPDIIVGTTYQTQSRLFLGVEKGKFQEVTSTHFPKKMASVGDLELGDVDDDGDLDLTLSDWGPGNSMQNEGGRTMLWLNDGTGHFTDVTAAQMPNIKVRFSWDLEFIDFDNDFDLDIIVSSKKSGGGQLFVNDGKGKYESKRGLPQYTNNYDYEIMDLNQDGFLDLATVNDGEIVGGLSYLRREHIFLNDSTRRFKDFTSELWPDSENTGEDDNNIAFLDYDSDGDADFILSSLTGNDRLLINDGNAHFRLANEVLTGKATPFTLSLVLADLNQDNRLDIVMGQGEGEKDKDERIFMANNLPKDTAPPIISHHTIVQDKGSATIYARIHDNKSPSRSSDWKSVQLNYQANGQAASSNLSWYGEYLWKVTIENFDAGQPLELCAVDIAGNKVCLSL